MDAKQAVEFLKNRFPFRPPGGELDNAMTALEKGIAERDQLQTLVDSLEVDPADPLPPDPEEGAPATSQPPPPPAAKKNKGGRPTKEQAAAKKAAREAPKMAAENSVKPPTSPDLAPTQPETQAAA